MFLKVTGREELYMRNAQHTPAMLKSRANTMVRVPLNRKRVVRRKCDGRLFKS